MVKYLLNKEGLTKAEIRVGQKELNAINARQKLVIKKNILKKKVVAPKKKVVAPKKPVSRVRVGKGGNNKGNIPNNKLKCFMRSTNGRVYRTCVKKPGSKQVRGKPRSGGKGGEKAYKNAEDRSDLKVAKKMRRDVNKK